MASLVETLAIKLVGDTADFTQKMGDAEKKVETFGGKMQEIGGKIAGFGAGLTAGVTTPLVAMAVGAVDAASDMGESMNKVNVVFGESATEIQKWAEGGAVAFGLSKQQTLEAVGTFGNLFTAMELGVDQSAEMSTGIVELSADLASFNNMDPTEVLEKLRAGLVGEVEPLRTLGVNLTAATVEAKAFEMGLVELDVDMNKVQAATIKLEKAQAEATKALKEHGAGSAEYREAANKVAIAEDGVAKALEGSKVELTAAQKAQASYALIMEQTTTAQGDFTRTSDGLANQQRIVRAQFLDMAATLGQQLLPIALKITTWISDAITWFQKLSPETQKWILIAAGIAAALGPVLVVLGTLISSIGTIISVFTAAGPVITVIGGVIAALGAPITIIIAAVAALALAWSNNWFGIRDKTKEAWEAIKNGISSAWEFVKNLVTNGVNGVKTFITDAWNAIKNVTSDIWNGIRDTIGGVVERIRGFFQIDWGGIGRGLVEGIVKGIQGAWNWLVDTVRGLANAAFTAAKQALGIGSPSKKGIELGLNFGESFGMGTEQSLRSLSNHINSGLTSAMRDFSPRASMAGAGGMMTAPITINFYGNPDKQQVAAGVESGLFRAGLRQVGLR